MNKLYPYFELIRDQVKETFKKNDFEVNTRIPFSMQINLLNKCYQNCIGCRKPEWPNVQLPVAYVEQAIRWLTHVRKAHSVVFSGGDPTAYKDFIHVLEYAKENGLATGVLTACLWGKNFNVEAFLRYSNWISISIDGATEETYTKTRGVNTLEKVKENVKLLNKIKKENGLNTRIRCNTTVSNVNIHEMGDILKLCVEELGIECNFYPIHTWDELKVQKIEKSEVENIVQIAMRENINANYSNTNISEFVSLMNRKPTPVCIIPWVHAFLDANGDIMHCCRLINDNGEYNRDPSMIIGNVFKDNINFIMNNQRTNTLARKTYKADHECCSECDRYNAINTDYLNWKSNDRDIFI